MTMQDLAPTTAIPRLSSYRLRTDRARSVFVRVCHRVRQGSIGILLATLSVWLSATPAGAQTDNTLTRADTYRAERATACRGGDLDACAQEGQNYWAGVRVPQNLSLAAEFLGRACDGDRPAACVSLGRLYMADANPTPRPRAALSLFERACAAREVNGCVAGAVALQTPDGRQYSDWAQAEPFLQRACQLGHTESCWRWGVVYMNGEGVERDFGRAAAPMASACRGGGRPACAIAARLFGGGHGVSRNLNVAEQMAERGCALGDQDSCDLRDHTRSLLEARRER